MIPFNFTKPIPDLPTEKNNSVYTQIVADGVLINVSIKIFLKYDDRLVFQIEFESDTTTTRVVERTGEEYKKGMPNPISETGYRNEFLTIHPDDMSQYNSAGEIINEPFDLTAYLLAFVQVKTQEEAGRWEQSKQYSLF